MKAIQDNLWENWIIWETAEPGLQLVEMRCCGFRFDAAHEDDKPGTGHYTCPEGCPKPKDNCMKQWHIRGFRWMWWGFWWGWKPNFVWKFYGGSTAVFTCGRLWLETRIPERR